MIDKYFKDKSIIIFTIISLLFFALMLILENLNDRFQTNDLRVMYDAANALRHGDTVYGISFGLSTGYYKYSPFTLLLFVPYSLVSLKTAAFIHFFIISISAIFSIILIEKIINKYFFNNDKYRLLSYLLILILVLLHVVKDLHLGNTNTILIFTIVLTIYNSLNKKYLLAGLFFALAIITKPYFAIAVLPFLLYKQYKTVMYTALSGFIFVLLTVVFMGFSKSLSLHLEWFSAMLEHSKYLTSSYTIFYLLDYYTGIKIPTEYSYHFFVFIGILSFVFFYLLKRKDEKLSIFNENQSLMMFFFFIIAITPNILITDNEHFIFSLPIIAFVILYLISNKNYYILVLFFIGALMYGGNSTDLVGADLTLKIKFWGFLGIGNLIILSIAMYLFYSKRNTFK